MNRRTMKNSRFCRAVFLETPVRLNMLWSNIGKNSGRKANTNMAMLFNPFGGNFQNGIAASCTHRVTQKFLQTKPPGHRHFKRVEFFAIIDFKTNGRERSNRHVGLLKNKMKHR